jgi:hypothetical protein
MEITTTTVNRNSGRRAVVTALAIVGFIALIIMGIALVILGTRLVPSLNTASVYLSSIFHTEDREPTLQVVTSTTTLPVDETVVLTPVATTTVVTPNLPTTTTKPATVSTTPRPATVTTTRTTVITSAKPDPYGKSDLTVRITDVGYMRRDGNTESFVSSNDIDRSRDGGVKFTVTNTGTNVTGSWKFEIKLPSSPSRTFTSPTQRSIGPGDSIEYVLGFEKPRRGDNRDITITVDPTDRVSESNERNNESSRSIDID